MRFKKGSKVEVMNKEVPASWCVAEIVSSNGHGYNVRYDGYEGVERVSRRFVRPSAPAIGSQNWVSGDIVEVFDENSWKVATVSKVLKGGRFLVRLHGFSHEIRAHKTNVRARQAWRDGQWVPVAKISGSNGVEPMIYQKEDNDARLQKRKRSSPFCSSLHEAKKVKHAEKDGSQSQSQSQRRVSTHSFEKRHNWRHASLASKGSKQDSGSAAFLLEKAVGRFGARLLQIRQSVAFWHLSKRLKMCRLIDQPPLSLFNVISSYIAISGQP
ncbi:putative chromatin remodeling & transcriptional activation CHROMO-DOMAIN family [Helianthus debilis subsp. tardiflorus]